jgi:hypothetical protein
MHTHPVLIDIDETIYPFIHTVDRWFATKHGQSVDWEALTWWYDLDLYLPNHVDRQDEFARALHELNPHPIPDALKSLQTISADYPIVACTARNQSDWSASTEEWISEHFPFVSDVIYVRDHRGADPMPKSEIARRLGAAALIDDTAAWMVGLPTLTVGHVVKRPAPLASDAGARPWGEIATDLRRQT